MYVVLLACIYTHHMHVEPIEARIGHQIFWNLSYGWLWLILWCFEPNPGLPSARRVSALNHWAIPSGWLCQLSPSVRYIEQRRYTHLSSGKEAVGIWHLILVMKGLFEGAVELKQSWEGREVSQKGRTVNILGQWCSLADCLGFVILGDEQWAQPVYK